MSDEKKGFWSKLFMPKKSSDCCSIEFHEEPEEPAAEEETAAKEDTGTDSESGQPRPAPCCGGARMPIRPRRGGGNCCG